MKQNTTWEVYFRTVSHLVLNLKVQHSVYHWPDSEPDESPSLPHTIICSPSVYQSHGVRFRS